MAYLFELIHDLPVLGGLVVFVLRLPPSHGKLFLGAAGLVADSVHFFAESHELLVDDGSRETFVNGHPTAYFRRFFDIFIDLEIGSTGQLHGVVWWARACTFSCCLSRFS
jgi:hypothetical protein